ncbi:MAG: hypothetical protein ACKO3W_08450 [bacterium]
MKSLLLADGGVTWMFLIIAVIVALVAASVVAVVVALVVAGAPGLTRVCLAFGRALRRTSAPSNDGDGHRDGVDQKADEVKPGTVKVPSGSGTGCARDIEGDTELYTEDDVSGDPSAENRTEFPVFIRFDEPALDRVEQAFVRLVASGVLVCELATEESRVLARIPAHAGPVFRSLARRYRSIAFPEVGVRVVLHDGDVGDDALGGWRLRAEPDELDIRLPPPEGWPGSRSGDEIVDATWSPHDGSEAAQHSTILHFIVRAAVGNRI